MRGLLRNIVVFLTGVFVSGSVMGATIEGGTNPGKAFEIASNWNGGSLPGTYTDANSDGIYDFNVANNTPLYIEGYVKLTGNLKLLNWGNLYLRDNAILIIDGNFELGDCSDVYIGQNATLYITGNLNAHNVASNYWYIKIEQEKNSNVVIEKNLTSVSGNFFNGDNASIVIYPKTGTSDFYVFGSTSGTVYRTTNGTNAKDDGLKEVDNETSFEANETTLATLITTISESIDEETSCTTLTIPRGSTHIIREGTSETYCYIALEQGSTWPVAAPGKLIIENGGTLNLTKPNSIRVGQIYNYGTMNVDSLFVKTGQNNGFNTIFYNAGTINATKSVYFGKAGSSDWDNSNYANSEYFTLTCGSVINAQNALGFYFIQPYFKAIGSMNASKIYILNTDGYNYSGNLIVDACADIRTEDLTINGNVNNIKIYGHIIADNINSSKQMIVSDDNENNTHGILTIGGSTSSNIKYVVDTKSIMNLCFNPNKNSADNLGFCLGSLLYLSNSEATGWVGDVTPETERDINDNVTRSNPYNELRAANGGVDLHAKNLIAAYSSYADCMNEKNMASLLPIELVSFSFNKSRNEFVWITASETNNDYFVVEYSKNGKDWVECTEHVQSQSDNGYTYGTEPIMPINESLFSYFRLKQVDLNGEFSYSDVITISFTVENPCSEEYEDSKMQIREFGNRYYRLINGELIYCENDNE